MDALVPQDDTSRLVSAAVAALMVTVNARPKTCMTDKLQALNNKEVFKKLHQTIMSSNNMDVRMAAIQRAIFMPEHVAFARAANRITVLKDSMAATTTLMVMRQYCMDNGNINFKLLLEDLMDLIGADDAAMD